MKEVHLQSIHLSNQLREAEVELDKLHGLLEEKVDEVEEYKRRLVRQEAETARYRNLQNHIDSQEKKIVGLNTEIERLNMLLKSRLVDLDQLKSHCQGLDQAVRQLPELERQNAELAAHLHEQSMREEELVGRLNRNETELRMLKLNEKKLLEAD